MHFQFTSVLALCAASVSALAHNQALATSCAYPAIASTIAKCKTESAFCSSVLGRGPATTIISVATVTSTVPASTITYSEIKSTVNVTVTSTYPVLSTTKTILSCVDASPSGNGIAGARPAAETGAGAAGVAAAKTSCGVGAYPTAYISAACECDYDTTIIHGGTTKTVTSGVSQVTVHPHPTVTYTSKIYHSTATFTTTAVHSNCYPPANSTCDNNIKCSSNGYSYNFYYFICGDNHEYACNCGTDPTGTAACFDSTDVTCPDSYYGTPSPSCKNNYDCEDGYFCLTEYCSCTDPTVGVCAKADVCLGDTVSIVQPVYTSTFA